MSNPVKESKEQKMLTSEQIRNKIGLNNDDGSFPRWAIEKYSKTHTLRWLTQGKFYGDVTEVDQRGFEVVKNPETGAVQRWQTMVLGAMPLDLAAERKANVREATQSQEVAVKEKIEDRRDALQYEMDRLGYGGKKGAATKFNYNKSKVKGV